MRSLKLARIAAQAELLRLRRYGDRQIGRAVLAATALVFVLACLGTLHFAGYLGLLRADIAPLWATLIVAGVDLLLALILGLAALRNRPGRLEREALQVRLAAQQQMMEAAAMTAMVATVLRSLGMRKVYGLALAALTARYLGGRR